MNKIYVGGLVEIIDQRTHRQSFSNLWLKYVDKLVLLLRTYFIVTEQEEHGVLESAT